MAYKWNFPGNQFGTLSGIGEAGIETFRGHPYGSLAREICQNSLDAGLREGEPVQVVFSCFRMPTHDIPDAETLKDAMESCLKFWREQGSSRTVRFFQNALAVMKRPTVSVLRISDFNTTGLTGSDQDYNTPWQNLVKAAGVSDKSGSSGGSFGIGKAAPFACSSLRTVFYATRDRDGVAASQGIARLVSFPQKSSLLKRDTDRMTTGIGYYGESSRNRAIGECRSLDPDFRRDSTGTDLFVMGFMDDGDWEEEITISVLEDFLLSIYSNLLSVRVGSTNISRETLPAVMEKYREKAEQAYNYYLTLLSDQTRVIRREFEGMGEVELRVLIQNGLHRRVMMSRSSGMRVFDQKNISATIQFAGICVLQGEKLNAYFREMENPQHNSWEPERHGSPGEAKKMKKALTGFVREQVKELGRITPLENTDAEGVGEYLPDIGNGDAAARGEKQESLADTTREIDIIVSDVKSPVLHTESNASDDGDRGVSGEDDAGKTGDVVDEMDGGLFPEGGDGGPGGGSSPDTGAQVSIPGMDRPAGRAFQIRPLQIRLFRVDRGENRYRLMLVPRKSFESGYLEFKLSGEQGTERARVYAVMDVYSGQKLSAHGSRIYLTQTNAKTKLCLEFNVDYPVSCSLALEVKLYGY